MPPQPKEKHSRGRPVTTPQEAVSLPDELAALNERATVLLVGDGEDALPDGLDCDRLDGGIRVADLNGLGIYDLVIVTRLDATPEQVLGRLRDLHARRLLVTGHAAAGLPPDDMRALGFEHHAAPDAAGRIYICDRDRYNRPREWNSPENWANPDNFDKYRW